MNAIVLSKTFKSGNSVAVRLPKSFGIAEGTEVRIERRGPTIMVEVTNDAAEKQAAVARFVTRMQALPAPGVIEPRQPIEFPDRSGLS